MLLLSLNRRIFNPNDALKSLNLVPSHAKVLFYLIHTKSACNLFKSLEEQVKVNIYNKIKNLNEDELNMLSESIDNILKLIPKIT